MNPNYIIFILVLFLGCQSSNPEEKGSTAPVTSNTPPPNVNAESPNIEVQINNLPAGTVYLIGFLNEQQYGADSASVSPNGKFQFIRQEPYPSGFYYVYLPNKNAFQILLDEDQTLSVTADANNLLGTLKVSGNVDTELLAQNLAYEKQHQDKINPIIQGIKNPSGNNNVPALTAQRDKLIAERKAHLNGVFQQHPNSFFTKFKSAGQNPELKTHLKNPDGTPNDPLQVYFYRTEFWDNVDFNDERLLNTPVIINKLKRYITQLTVQHPDSIKKSTDQLIAKVANHPKYFQFFSNWITLNYEPTKTSLMDAEAVYVHMIQKYFTYDKAFWSDSANIYALQLRAEEMQASLVGNIAPNVSAVDINGQPRSINDLKTPYVIVYLYNPDCEHCQEETPKLVQFLQQNNKQLAIFAIAIDTDEAKWKNFVQRNKMNNFINVFDATNRSIYKKYYVDNTPEVYLLNPQREIIGKNLKVDQISEIIAKDKTPIGS